MDSSVLGFGLRLGLEYYKGRGEVIV